MLTNRSTMPDAARLLRFIREARRSPASPVHRLSSFIKIAHRQIGGAWWAGGASVGGRTFSNSEPYSMLGETVRTYLPHLMGDGIMPTIDPLMSQNRGWAKILQLRMRKWVDDTGYVGIDEACLLDALCGISVQYVTRNVGGPMFSDGADMIDTGSPVALRVPVERMVVSPDAESWDTAPGIGHYYEADRSAMLERGVGNPDVLMKCRNVWDQSDSDMVAREEKYDGDRTSDQYLEDKIRLYDLVYTYAGRRFCCTLPAEEGHEGFVVDPYEIIDEPEGSRYVVTALNTIPGSLTPVSPAMVIMDAHLAKSRALSKLMEQIETLKRKFVFKPGQQRLVMSLLDPNGDAWVAGDPDSFKETVIGGMVKELLDGYGFLDALGKQIGPNVQLAGGSDDPSDTATGTSVLAGNAAVVLGYWKRKINDGRTAVLRRVASMLTNSYERMEFEIPAGPGVSIPVVWEPSRHQLSYDMFKYGVKPSSNMAGMDARARLRSMAELFTALPNMVQVVVGLGGDPSKVVRVLSDLAEAPELDEMLPTPDMRSIQMLLLQNLGQSGRLTPGGMPGMAPGMAQGMVPGMAPGMAQGQLPAAGPMTPLAQVQSDAGRSVPA